MSESGGQDPFTTARPGVPLGRPGSVDEIAGRPFGILVVSVAAEPARIEAALAYLADRGLEAEVIGHVV